MPLDHAEGGVRAGIPGEHRVAAHSDHSEESGAAEREVVGGGECGQVDVVGGQVGDLGGGAGVERVVVVGPRDQLGQSGGPSGDQEQCRQIRVDDRRGPRGIGLGEGGELARLPGHEDLLHVGHSATQLGRELSVVETGVVVVADIGASARALGEVGDLGDAVGRQRHHRDQAGAEEAERGDGELDGVRQLHDHPVAGLQSRGGEARGTAICGCGELAVGECVVGVRDGGGRGLRAIPERGPQRAVVEDSGGSVLLSKVRTMGDEPGCEAEIGRWHAHSYPGDQGSLTYQSAPNVD